MVPITHCYRNWVVALSKAAHQCAGTEHPLIADQKQCSVVFGLAFSKYRIYEGEAERLPTQVAPTLLNGTSGW